MSGFAKPRWAFDFLLFSTEKADGKTMQISKQKSLDDENTPGVFHVSLMYFYSCISVYS